MTHSIPLFAAAAVLASLHPTVARAEEPKAGFFLEGRMVGMQTILSHVRLLVAGTPRSALGYREGRFSVAVAPILGKASSERELTEKRTTTESLLGTQLFATYTLASTSDRRGESYVLGGVALATGSTEQTGSGDDESTDHSVFAVLAGAGARYFFSSHLAAGAEIGLSASATSESSGSSGSSGEGTTSNSLVHGWSSINLQVVF